MRRRTFLATTATALTASLAGCSDPSGSLRLDRADTDRAVAKAVSEGEDNLDDERGRVVEGAVAGERPTANGTRPLFEAERDERRRPIAYDGSYYTISHETVETYEHTEYTIEIDFDPPDSYSPEIGAVDYDVLPEVDREAVSEFFPKPEYAPDGDGVDMGTSAIYSPSEERASVLVGDAEYDAITYDGTTYPIHVSLSGPVTVTKYQYTATQVAENTSTMAAQIRDRYLFELTDLSPEQREIVRTAAEEGAYRSDDPPSQAFVDVLDVIRSHDAVEAVEYGEQWLLSFEGTVYWAEVTDPLQTPTATPS